MLYLIVSLKHATRYDSLLKIGVCKIVVIFWPGISYGYAQWFQWKFLNDFS